MTELFRSIVRGFNSLLFPPLCISCQSRATDACSPCQNLWSSKSSLVQRSPFPVFSVMTYDNLTSPVVLAAKENGTRSARHLLALSFAAIFRDHPALFHPSIILVPIPSSNRSIRIRGERFLMPIINEGLRIADSKIEVRELLVQRKKVREQTGLSSKERSINMSGALRISEKTIRHWRSKPVILIDDVITTGSSMQSAYHALRERNLTVLAGMTACASSSRLPIR